MSKKLIYLTSFVLVLGLAVSASAELPPNWENQDIGNVGAAGSADFDSSTGTFTVAGDGGDIWGGTDRFHYAYTQITGDGEMVARVVDNGTGSNNWAKGGVMFREQLNDTSSHAMQVVTGSSGGGGAFQWVGWPGGSRNNNNSNHGGTSIAPPSWVRVVRSGNVFTGYYSTDSVNWTERGSATIDMAETIYVGLCVTSHANGELRTFTFDNISPQFLKPPEAASGPSPAHEATDVPREVVLSWTPGEFAPPVNGHKIYLSENFNDVNDGIGGITQDANSYTPPQRLDLGTTYYWRIDEVNGPPDYTVYEGDVWSFTTEPVAYPIQNIIATASSSAVAKEPENTINGSGLDESGLLHGKDGDDNMWLSDIAGPQPTWIEFQFDKVYKMHELWVWNSNEFLEPMVGFGFKDVTIEYSANGTDYTTLGTTHEFARAPGAPEYAHNTTVDFGGVAAKYVRLTANSNWGGLLNQYGLSEVRFLYIPVQAREPSPDSGATDVDVDVTLGFRAGREAVTHNVYVSADEQAVIDGTAPVTTVTETSYGPLSLDLDVTHYWKVNEVNEAETLTTWESSIWSFTTTEYLVVDDFESYNDLDPSDPASKRIFNVWIDGYGVATNGSLVGYGNPPFCEQTIVHGGSQSMPLFYDNTAGATYSEAELTLSPPQDWSKHGVKTLSLWFSGDPNNTAAQMYVKINGSKVVYDGDATNLTIKPWQPWNIDLAASGVNVANVTKLAIGIDGNGAAGILYFDDIRLYPHDRQLMTPTEPDPANLVGHWQLDGNSNDSSVNSRHGTAMGGPAFALGKIGQAIDLDGVDDYVNITGYKGIAADRTDPDNPVQPAFSIANWFKTTGNGEMVTWGSSDGTPVGGQYSTWRIDGGRLRAEHGNGNLRGNTYVNDGKWHHGVLVVTEGANLRVPATRLYVDGKQDTTFSGSDNIYNVTSEADVAIGRRAAQGDRYFPGMIDDVRIYDRVLTEEEIAWLAGRTEPFDKPF